jgi:hypothetical protein
MVREEDAFLEGKENAPNPNRTRGRMTNEEQRSDSRRSAINDQLGTTHE